MTSYHSAGFNVDWTPLPVYLGALAREHEARADMSRLKAPTRPSDAEIQKKIDNARLVAQGLEFLLKVWPSIPGASVTLTPAQQDELRQIILSLPAAVAL